MILNIAVISDLHCHHSSSGYAETLLLTDAPRFPVNHHPVSALNDLIDGAKLKADILLTPGDITNKADAQGINSGWGYINEIAAHLNVQTIAATLGNHDVQSHDSVDDPCIRARSLYPRFPNNDPVKESHFWGRGFYVIDEDTYRVLVINSVASSNIESAKRGLISEMQLHDIGEYLKSSMRVPFQIALCHHHPIQHEDLHLGHDDLMVNGSLLVELLYEHNFNILVHGHKHHPRLSYSGQAGKFPVLASGSFSAGLGRGLATRTRNLFHLITIHDDAGNGGPGGIIKTWQFQHSLGWQQASCDAADFPFMTGFGDFSPPAEIAERICSKFEELHTNVAFWDSLSPHVRQLPYLPPKVFRMVGAEVQRRGLVLYPTPPDTPIRIGRYA